MARLPTEAFEKAVNPNIRFERTDVEDGYKFIVWFAIILTLTVGATVVAMIIWGRVLLAQEQPVKATDLPPWYVDTKLKKTKEGDEEREKLLELRLPPQPRLEALEDLGWYVLEMDQRIKGKPRLLPPRAAEHFAPQDKLLAEGDKEKGQLPIKEAFKQLQGKLPTRPDSKAPTTWSTPLPSRGAAGRVETGGS